MDDKHLRVEATEMDENDPLTMAIVHLVFHAIKNGVTNDEDTVTVLVPSFQMGETKDTMSDTGEYEITIKKVGDRP